MLSATILLIALYGLIHMEMHESTIHFQNQISMACSAALIRSPELKAQDELLCLLAVYHCPFVHTFERLL